jgi:hypothetical protein
MSGYGTEQDDHIRTWRGQRYVAWRCSDCGRAFYSEEPQQGLLEILSPNEKVIDDEEELQAAEEELRKQADEEGDHRYKIS